MRACARARALNMFSPPTFSVCLIYSFENSSFCMKVINTRIEVIPYWTLLINDKNKRNLIYCRKYERQNIWRLYAYTHARTHQPDRFNYVSYVHSIGNITNRKFSFLFFPRWNELMKPMTRVMEQQQQQKQQHACASIMMMNSFFNLQTNG